MIQSPTVIAETHSSTSHRTDTNSAWARPWLGDTTFAATVSNVVTVTTLWNFKDTSACPNGHCHISGKLIPRTRHHKILVQVKHGAWHKYAVLHTSAKGKYTVKVTGSRRGTKYRIIITATKHITATKKGYIVTVL